MDLIGRDQMIGSKDRPDLRINRLHRRQIKGQQRRRAGHGDLVVLEVHDHQDGHVIGVSLRPVPHLRYALNKGLANAAIVEVGHMHDLQTRCSHQAGVIGLLFFGQL